MEAGPVPACVTWACSGNEFGSFGPALGQSAAALKKSVLELALIWYFCVVCSSHAKGQPFPLISRTSADFGCFSIFNFPCTQLEQEPWCLSCVMQKICNAEKCSVLASNKELKSVGRIFFMNSDIV